MQAHPIKQDAILNQYPDFLGVNIAILTTAVVNRWGGMQLNLLISIFLYAHMGGRGSPPLQLA